MVLLAAARMERKELTAANKQDHEAEEPIFAIFSLDPPFLLEKICLRADTGIEKIVDNLTDFLCQFGAHFPKEISTGAKRFAKERIIWWRSNSQGKERNVLERQPRLFHKHPPPERRKETVCLAVAGVCGRRIVCGTSFLWSNRPHT